MIELTRIRRSGHQSWIVALDFKSAATENFHRDRIHLFFVNNKILVAFKE